MDLADPSSDSIAIRFSTDTTVLLDVAYALYGSQIPEAPDQDHFDGLIDEAMEEDDEFIDNLREVVTDAVSGFFPLLKTVSTALAEAQATSQKSTTTEEMTD